MIDRQEELVDYLADAGKHLAKQSLRMEQLQLDCSATVKDIKALIQSIAENREEDAKNQEKVVHKLNELMHMVEARNSEVLDGLGKQWNELREQSISIQNLIKSSEGRLETRVSGVQQATEEKLTLLQNSVRQSEQAVNDQARAIKEELLTELRMETARLRKFVVWLAAAGVVSLMGWGFVLGRWVLAS